MEYEILDHKSQIADYQEKLQFLNDAKLQKQDKYFIIKSHVIYILIYIYRTMY